MTPFWAAPALLKAIIAMVGNLLLAPVAVAIIFYFVTRPRMGSLAVGRNGAGDDVRVRAESWRDWPGRFLR
jgi:hypothetical protein